MAELKTKEYMFAFKSGGWGLVSAKTKRGAMKTVLMEYEDSPTMNPIPSSVTLATPSGLKLVMSIYKP
jgi:hypothetical protein